MPPLSPVSTTGYADQSTTNQTQKGATTGQSTSTGLSMGQFTPGQQALQGQIPGLLGGYLSGQTQIPSYITAPPAAFKAYNDAFQQNVAPGLAAQYGAGSPQIGAQQTMGNEQLAANLYQSGLSNWMSGLGLGGQMAFNPIGTQVTSSGNTAGTSNQTNQGTTNASGLQTNGLLPSILTFLMGGI